MSPRLECTDTSAIRNNACYSFCTGIYVYHATTWKVVGSISYEVIEFFNWPNPSRRIMVLGSTQPLTEMSTRNIPMGKGRPACKADNLTTMCEPIV
jgi:hypothetical protein